LPTPFDKGLYSAQTSGRSNSISITDGKGDDIIGPLVVGAFREYTVMTGLADARPIIRLKCFVCAFGRCSPAWQMMIFPSLSRT
jgi:hypothetical protein